MLVLKSKLERHPYTKLHPLFASQKPRCGLVLRPRAPLIAFILANSHGDFLRGKIRGGGTKQPAPPYQRPAASPPQKGGAPLLLLPKPTKPPVPLAKHTPTPAGSPEIDHWHWGAGAQRDFIPHPAAGTGHEIKRSLRALWPRFVPAPAPPIASGLALRLDTKRLSSCLSRGNERQKDQRGLFSK